jgi:hypothetical protein
MTTQNEWRKINYEYQLGKRTGETSGSIHGQRGAQQYQQGIKERADRDRSLKNSYSRGLGSNSMTLGSGDNIPQMPRERSAAKWTTASTVIFFVAFAATFLFFRYTEQTHLGNALLISCVTSAFLGLYHRTILLIAFACAMLAAMYMLYAHFHQ